jgi:hypothetical protein
MTSSQHAYEVRPRKDKRGVDLISDALPFGRLWYSFTRIMSRDPTFNTAARKESENERAAFPARL